MPDEQPTEDRARPGDEPITKLADDRLELGSYIFGLLRTMERAETPFTVGVFGNWGSGKTSFLNLLEDAAKLPEWPRPDAPHEEHEFNWRVVRVNPWECDTPEDAKRLLASSLWAEMSSASVWDARAKMRVAGRRYQKAAVAATDTVARSAGVSGVGDGVEALFSADASIAQEYRTYFEQDLKTALGKKGRMLVLIDDLDRAPRKVIPEVLETIKLYLDQKGCVFVLAADPAVVAEAVSDLYKPEKGESQVSGEQYLEKIVQLPFYLPRLDDDLTKSFFEHCSALMCEERGISEELGQLLIEDILQRNPRAIKRFCMTHGLLAEVAPDLDADKLAKVLGLQMAFPEFFKLCQILPRLMFEDQQAFRAIGEDSEQAAMLERWNWLKEQSGEERAKQHVDAATDPRLMRFLSEEPHFTNEKDPEQYLTYTSVAAAAEGEPGDRFDRAMEMLKSDNDEARAMGVRVLSSLGDARCVDVLVERLEDESEDEEVRMRAAWALGELGDKRAVAPLIERLEDKGEGVRRNAAGALGELGDKRAVEPLIKRLADKSEGVRGWAAWALAILRDARAVEPLIEKLVDKSEMVRWRAAGALGLLHDARAVEPLIESLEEEGELVRTWSARALGLLGDKRAVQPLIAGLDDESGDMREAAAEVLGRIGAQAGAALLILREMAQNDESEFARGKASKAVEKIEAAIEAEGGEGEEEDESPAPVPR